MLLPKTHCGACREAFCYFLLLAGKFLPVFGRCWTPCCCASRHFLFYLSNNCLQLLGQPMSRSNASGAPQFAPRSIKSQIGSPTIGRTSAVQNPQIAIHKIAMRIGFTNTRTARVTSITPTRNSSVVAGSGAEIPNIGNHSIHAFLPLCPRQESDLDSRVRSAKFYPLNYEGSCIILLEPMFRPKCSVTWCR